MKRKQARVTGELGVGNARVKEAAKLLLKKHRRETGCVLIEGARLVGDAIAAGAKVRGVFATRAFLESPPWHGHSGRDSFTGKMPVLRLTCETPVPRLTGKMPVPQLAGETPVAQPVPPPEARGLAELLRKAAVISEAAAGKLSETRTPQGVFAVVEYAQPPLSELRLGPNALVLAADGISDPGNLGTMIRSAAALGAHAVVASGDCCDVLNPKVVRATMGAIFRVPVVSGLPLSEAVAGLRDRGLRIVAAVAREGRAPWEADLRGPVALLIGSEAEGLPPGFALAAEERVTIPMPGGAESLNAAGAAAVLLYEASRQRGSG